MSIAPIDRFDELPRVNGPKPRFKYDHRGIEYLDLLAREDHGYLFKVRINGELYALKIV